MNEPIEFTRLNTDIPTELKTDIEIYVAMNNSTIKEVTAIALRLFLDEMGFIRPIAGRG